MPSMPDFNKIKASIGNGLEALSNKSTEFIEVSKLKFKIQSEESNMKDLHEDMGRELYSMFKKGHHIDSSLLDYCNALKKIEKRIKHLEKKLYSPYNKG